MHTLLICLVLFVPAKAQHVDFQQDKSLSQLGQLNPALTGVLNQFRILSNRSEAVNIGLESRVLRSKNYLSFMYSFDAIDYVHRNSTRFAYARNIIDQLGVMVKAGIDLDFQSKVFQGGNSNGISFNDFDGFRYELDSGQLDEIKDKISAASLGFGASAMFRSIVFGISIKNINSPDLSMLKGEVRNAEVDVTSSLVGFIDLGSKWRLIPNVLYSLQGENTLIRTGLGFKCGRLIFNGNFQIINDEEQLSLALGLRHKRHFLLVGYNGIGDPFNLNQVSVTINSSLFKLKDSGSTITDKLKSVY